MRSCRCNRQRGFTLLEVIVGLTLMATVLVGSLLSFAAHRRQRHLADNKILASAFADELLNVMTTSSDGIPNRGRGPVPGRPRWYWQTNSTTAIVVAEIPLRVIRFEIIEQTGTGSVRPLVSIDVVEPLEG